MRNAAQAESGAVEYTAFNPDRGGLPWIGPPFMGPLIGAAFLDKRVKWIPVAGAADPAVRSARVAAFVPVVKDAGRIVPADAAGNPADVRDVAWWIQPVRCDKNTWFRIDVEAHSLQGKFYGVLLGLVYNEFKLDPEGLRTWMDLFSPGEAIFDPEATWGSRGTRSRLAARDVKNPKALTAIEELIEKLLHEQPVDVLERSLIVASGEATAQPDPAQGASRARVDSAQDTEITFAVASCQYPAGILDAQVADASYARLARRLDESGAPECLLLLGDQIYVDETAGLFDPRVTADRFLARYEGLYRSEAVRDVFRRVAAYTMLDDHEIEDNWEPRRDCGEPEPILEEGRRAYLEFQRRAGPRPRSPEGDSTHPLWYEFERRGFPFFMADTRTERERRTAASVTSARIMSRTQFTTLLDWLGQCDPDVPKFIASPSNFLPRHLRVVRHPANALRSDAWDGYPHSFHRLLAYIATQQIKNVVFLSGDEHVSCVARATVKANGGQPVTLLSVHSSALHAPFPFANATEADFAGSDFFSFDLPNAKAEGFKWGGNYTCDVRTEFAPGDGFALLRFFRQDGKWAMACEFDRESGKVQIVQGLEG